MKIIKHFPWKIFLNKNLKHDIIRMSEIGGSSWNTRQSPYLIPIHQIRIKKVLIAKNKGNGSTQLKKKSNH